MSRLLRLQGEIAQRADAVGDIGALFQQVEGPVAVVQLQLNIRIALTETATSLGQAESREQAQPSQRQH